MLIHKLWINLFKKDGWNYGTGDINFLLQFFSSHNLLETHQANMQELAKGGQAGKDCGTLKQVTNESCTFHASSLLPLLINLAQERSTQALNLVSQKG